MANPSSSIYMEAAEEALTGARYNLHGGYYAIVATRAYYAFLYAATALLLTKDITRSKHSAVLSAFRQHFVRTGLIEPQFSDAFGQAFEVRMAADYDVLGTIDEKQAQEVIANAARFVQRVKQYLDQWEE